MDLTRVQETVNPVNQQVFSSDKKTTIRGGKVVSHPEAKNMRGAIIDQLDE